jgi:hypothetical protein
LEERYHLIASNVFPYIEGKTPISGAAEMASLTIPEMVEYLVNKGYKSSYSLEDFRRGVTLLKKAHIILGSWSVAFVP